MCIVLTQFLNLLRIDVDVPLVPTEEDCCSTCNSTSAASAISTLVDYPLQYKILCVFVEKVFQHLAYADSSVSVYS